MAPSLTEAKNKVVEQHDAELGYLSDPLLKPVPAEEVKTHSSGAKDKESIDDEDKDSTPRRVFQVVAPANLPKGYHLTVFAGSINEEVVVLVPPGGVRNCQKFEGKEARPIDKRWSDSEFDFSPTYEGSFFYLALCYPIIGWAFVMEKLEMRGGHLLPWILGIVSFSLSLFAPQPLFFIFFICVGTIARAGVRGKYRIPGSYFGDCICSTFCSCCTLLQSYRHMRRNGDTPCQGCGANRNVKAIQV